MAIYATILPHNKSVDIGKAQQVNLVTYARLPDILARMQEINLVFYHFGIAQPPETANAAIRNLSSPATQRRHDAAQQRRWSHGSLQRAGQRRYYIFSLPVPGGKE
jgi:hypothetical protein